MGAFFITGSGTGVGKTYVTCRLIERDRRTDRSVEALKPVISGWNPEDPGEFEASDTVRILRALGRDATPAAIDACSPHRFREPLSPDMAAARENRGISFDLLVDICREAIESAGDEETLYIEGVGGVMVPLTDDKLVLDWIAALNIPAILVVGSYLGTLSHTLTAALALESRNIPIYSVIISESEESPVPMEETAATLQRFLGGLRIETVGRNKQL